MIPMITPIAKPTPTPSCFFRFFIAANVDPDWEE